MFNNSSKIMFFFILMMSTMITISANSWLGAWMGLEINLLSFIPLMNDNNLMSNESSLKYFLTQALASSILLFSTILFMYKNNFMYYNKNNAINMMILSSLLMKSGTAPFHFWFPNVMEGMSWINALILMTWQKIGPLMLISYLIIKPMLFVSIILSVIVGSLGGLNQTSLRKLMTFSSINHLGWMLMSMYSNESLWITYFLFYSFMTFNMIFLFNMFKLYHINQLFSLFLTNKIFKFSLFLNLLSLGGLPPFMGFIPKWLTIQYLTFNNQLFMLTVMILMTLITLFFYLRLCYTAFMLNHYENNWNFNIYWNNFSMNIYLTLSFISTFGLFIISLIYYLI
uniref:NADH-ubiquinone oxidoreductase chain 2 n=2 Tax=Eristalinus TaxID=115278 RepID=A0A4P8Y4E9_9MUSC|nr:NADH dehydrogenase subunit 2 [Eristalinus fuscicornis]YP_009660938.1 NADH dehydrogenase subunit 2 [Eristalinus barclayi]QCT09689.1 NADH dehydrogenase subunit 2 [Eristalinus fuscicornis]QCT09702.1 NADH dehydrogenase subunit 2 [Eristalinus barclayi]